MQCCKLVAAVKPAILSAQPASLGFPGDTTQSAYYPGPEWLSRAEIAAITKAMDSWSIEPENTRICKETINGQLSFHVRVASVGEQTEKFDYEIEGRSAAVYIERGEYSTNLDHVCRDLEKALVYAETESQRSIIKDYLTSFKTGNLNAYRESQKKWVSDRDATIENVFGFVETYRDPQGVRAEWEGLVAISDAEETAVFKRFVAQSATFLRYLPWVANAGDTDGQGPFEKQVFQPPDFTSLHGKSCLAFA